MFCGGWVIETPPYINGIEFNMTNNNAKVSFNILNFGGHVKFLKIFGKWRKVKSKITYVS